MWLGQKKIYMARTKLTPSHPHYHEDTEKIEYKYIFFFLFFKFKFLKTATNIMILLKEMIKRIYLGLHS